MELANDTNWITKFDLQVTPSSNRIFANGRHQLEISVGVKLKEGYTLSEEQLNSLELVVLHDNGEYVSLNGERYKVSATRDSRFEYYGDTGSAPGHLTPPPVTVHKRFYVSSTASGGTRQTVYALIRKDDQTYYVSATSRFNSYAIIESVTPLRKGQEEFTLERVHDRELTVRTGKYHPNKYWIDFYYLSFKNVDFRIVDVEPFNPDEGSFYFADYSEITPWYEGPRPPAHVRLFESNFHYVFTRNISEVKLDNSTTLQIKHREDAMTFMRVELTGPLPYQKTSGHSRRWSVLDQYGNAYRVRALQLNSGNAIDFQINN